MSGVLWWNVERVDTLWSRTPLTQSPDNLPHLLEQRNHPESAVDPPPRFDGYTGWSGDYGVEFRNHRWSADISFKTSVILYSSIRNFDLSEMVIRFVKFVCLNITK